MLIEDGVLDALPLSYTGMLLKFFVTCAMTTSFCKAGEWKEYRRQVLILLPRSYEPRALPMRHAGKTVCALIV